MEEVFNSTAQFIEIEDENAYKTYIGLIQYLMVVTATFGTIGNVFAYMTAVNFSQKSSGQTFIKCLAVSDTLAGFQDGILESLPPAMFSFDLFVQHTLLCRWKAWVTNFSSIAC